MSRLEDLGKLLQDLDNLAAQDALHGFTMFKTKHGYQTSLRTEEAGGYRVMRKDTPSEGIAAVLSMDHMEDAATRVHRSETDFADAAIADLVAEAEAEPDEDEFEFKPAAKPSLFD